METGGRADRFAYLHGFASGAGSRKGSRLAAAFRARGAVFHQPDLNLPSFAELTYSGMLRAVDELDRRAGDAAQGGRWGFVGSSMGGWVAARWAELHPERVVTHRFPLAQAAQAYETADAGVGGKVGIVAG